VQHLYNLTCTYFFHSYHRGWDWMKDSRKMSLIRVKIMNLFCLLIVSTVDTKLRMTWMCYISPCFLKQSYGTRNIVTSCFMTALLWNFESSTRNTYMQQPLALLPKNATIFLEHEVFKAAWGCCHGNTIGIHIFVFFLIKSKYQLLSLFYWNFF
jgi:hypothetical protein